MTVLYVREPGARIGIDVERVRVTVKDKATRKTKVLNELPVREIEQVVIMGNVQLSTQATRLLLRHGVDVIIASQSGAYHGRISKDGSRFARLRHEQLRRADKPRDALALAAGVVDAKIAGQAHVLDLLADQRAAQQAKQLSSAAGDIRRMRNAARKAASLDALRGFEGKASAHYFGAIRRLIDPAWSFKAREFRPPPDPFNAVLSFTYTLLLKDIETIAHRVGLDPYIGCLHTMEYGRPSLVLDLMEEFRPLVADYAVLDLVLGKKLEPKDFTFTGRKDRPVELGEALIPLVLKAYEARAGDRIRHRPSDADHRLRTCYELQARIYARTVLGDRARFEGVVA